MHLSINKYEKLYRDFRLQLHISETHYQPMLVDGVSQEEISTIITQVSYFSTKPYTYVDLGPSNYQYNSQSQLYT